jgi:small GTP-binding protein
MMLRYCDNQFNVNAISTIGVDFKTKNVMIDGVPYRVQIWDTAGQERYRGIVDSYYRRAQGIVVCYDVTKPGTFTSLETWFSSIDKYAAPGTPVIICGNKTDLASVVSFEDAESFGHAKGAAVFLTSAANGEGIDSAFMAIAETAAAHSGASPKAESGSTPMETGEQTKKKTRLCAI